MANSIIVATLFPRYALRLLLMVSWISHEVRCQAQRQRPQSIISSARTVLGRCRETLVTIQAVSNLLQLQCANRLLRLTTTIPTATMTTQTAPNGAPLNPTRKPIPLSASQESQVRELYYKRVRNKCADEVRGKTSPSQLTKHIHSTLTPFLKTSPPAAPTKLSPQPSHAARNRRR